MNETVEEHPSFILAKSLEEPWRGHFPKDQEEAKAWKRQTFRYTLGSRIIIVATTRIECGWAAYCGVVPGYNHDQEWRDVLRHGDKIPEHLARVMFLQFPKEVPYIL